MTTNDAITAWAPARIYRTPSGPLLSSIMGSFGTSSNAICTHGKLATSACHCGFTTLASRTDAEDESYGMPVLEVEHQRETLWTDGTVVRALTQDVKRVHLGPECHECSGAAVGVGEVPVDERASVDAALEPVCDTHAAGGITSLEDLSLELGVEVLWSTSASRASWSARAEAEEVLFQASMAIRAEQVLGRLDDADARHDWAGQILSGGPEAFLEMLVSLHLVPVEELRKRRAALAHLMVFVGEKEKLAMAMAGSEAGEHVELLVEAAGPLD